MATVERLRKLGAVDVTVGSVSCTFAAAPEPERVTPTPLESQEERQAREAAAKRERERLENWSSS